jgi:predicted RNase H-like HicB family nuclease
MTSFELKTRTSVRYDYDTGVYVSSCPELGLVSQGVIEEEAERAIQSAINLFVITCHEHEILHSTLERLRSTAVEPKPCEADEKMMVQCSPEDLKKILELFGYRVHLQDAFNWSMTRGAETPVVIPKCGDVVSIEAINWVFARIGMGPGSSKILSKTPAN